MSTGHSDTEISGGVTQGLLMEPVWGEKLDEMSEDEGRGNEIEISSINNLKSVEEADRTVVKRKCGIREVQI